MIPPHERENLNLPCVGICSFGKFPIHTDLDTLKADIGILGMPYDMGTQWRSGAKMGPRGLRDASTLCSVGLGAEGVYDHERDVCFLNAPASIVDCGDVDMVHGDLEQSFDNIETAVRRMAAAGTTPVGLGGDHSVTIPLAKGLAALGPFHVIQIDAHLDWADHRSGMRLGQGSPIRRLSEMDHVLTITQLGIRGVGSSRKSDFDDAKAYGSRILSPRQIRGLGIQNVIDQLPPNEKYFITFDIDGMDSSLAHGTGTPAPGGLWYDEIQEIFEALAKRGHVVGFDLVEVAPAYDPTQVTSLAAARLIVDFISFILKERERKGLLRGQR